MDGMGSKHHGTGLNCDKELAGGIFFRSLVSFYIAQKSVTFLFVVFRPDHLNISGVAKDAPTLYTHIFWRSPKTRNAYSLAKHKVKRSVCDYADGAPVWQGIRKADRTRCMCNVWRKAGKRSRNRDVFLARGSSEMKQIKVLL